MGIQEIDSANHVTPVNGIPMRAKDTLLAQLMQSSTGRYMLLSRDGHVDNLIRNATSRYMVSLKDLRRASFKRVEVEASTINDPERIRHFILNTKSKVGKLISVEIECYNLQDYGKANRGLTEIVHDGSLSSRHGVGRELRRISWVDKDGRLSGLLGLEKHFKGASVDKTCGLHVHIDARHLPKRISFEDQMVDPGYLHTAAETYDRLTLLYPVLKKLIPKSRWNNRYCRLYNNRENSDTYRSPADGDRYSAINWCSYSKHGTIEFRLCSGSTNLVKIESWALICQYLFDWCSKRSNTVPTKWPQFLAILPGWMKDWCIMRNLKLHGGFGGMTDRVASAVDFRVSSGVVGTNE